MGSGWTGTSLSRKMFPVQPCGNISPHHDERARDTWREKALTPPERELIISYLKSRWHGSADWISFHQKPDFSLTEDVRRLGIDPLRPFALALTNVFWDAQIHYPANAFASQKDWLVETVRWFADRPHLQLASWCPAEITGTSNPGNLSDVERRVLATAAKCHLFGPESRSHVDLALCDAAIIFRHKTGLN